MVMLTCVALGAIPWLAFLRSRIGGLASLALVTLSAPTLLVGVMILARSTGAPLAASTLAMFALVAAAGWTLAARSRSDLHWGGTASLRDVLAAGIGALVALATFVLSLVLPGSPRVSWAMLGDSASQLEYARLIMVQGGLTPPPMANPVPLPPALVAAVAGPWRPSGEAGAVLSHDLGAYASTWAALIIVTCALAGAIGHAIVGHSSSLSGMPARATVAATSLLPLGWFWTGYPIKFGFINAQVVFVVLLASILGYLGTRRRPAVGLAIQVLAILMTLVTWSPLAVMPATLALIQALGALRAFGTWPRRVKVASLVAGAAGIGVALWLGIPMLLAARGSLGVPGGLAEFPKPMLPAAAVLVVAATLASAAWPGWRRLDRVTVGVLGLAVASLVGLAVVLVLSGTVAGPWTYYPHKYAWIATAVLLTIALPQTAGAFARLRSPRVRGIAYGAGALAVAASLGLGSAWTPGYGHFLRDSLPYLMLVEDNLPDEGQSPDAVADAVVARVGLERLTIPWESSLANDYRVSFWLIHLQIEEANARGDGAAAGKLWTLANFHDTPEALCELATVVPQGLTVQTGNAGLAGELTALCPGVDVIVEGDPFVR